MPTIDATVAQVAAAPTWNDRVAAIRLIPGNHGTNDLPSIHARIARELYVPHLTPDYAYVPDVPFYGQEHFQTSYQTAAAMTLGFTQVDPVHLATVLSTEPTTLLTFRTIVGLGRKELAATTDLVADIIPGLKGVTDNKIDSMERSGTKTTPAQGQVLAETICRIMDGSLFGDAPSGWRVKQDKPDTADGWTSVRDFAANKVPFALFLHQRHYGGAFRQLLDATSTTRGDIIEDAVQALFIQERIPFLRTGAHNQPEIARRFGVTVTPAPDFVVFDNAGTLRAMLECKGANDGGTARDKAARFRGLRDEANRLGGIPLLAVLGGIGWTRVNDALGPVVRDCDGRVFTVSTVHEMIEVDPFPSLLGVAPPVG